MEIYSSKKQSFCAFIASSFFVISGIFLLLYGILPYEQLIAAIPFLAMSAMYIAMGGFVMILFGGLGIFVSIRLLIKNKLILVIDETGINVNPSNPLSETIEWKNIEGFSEIEIYRNKFIIIDVNNSDYWIEKTTNPITRKTMEFNLSYCGSPFNLTANVTKLSHAELMNVLNENLQKYKT
jgi:hypothetical protein